jgi:hypothetical protein
MFLSALPPLIFNIQDIVVSLNLAKIVITYQYLKNCQPADMLRGPVASQILFELIFWYVKSNLNFYKQKLVASLFHGLLLHCHRFEMSILSQSDR